MQILQLHLRFQPAEGTPILNRGLLQSQTLSARSLKRTAQERHESEQDMREADSQEMPCHGAPWHDRGQMPDVARGFAGFKGSLWVGR